MPGTTDTAGLLTDSLAGAAVHYRASPAGAEYQPATFSVSLDLHAAVHRFGPIASLVVNTSGLWQVSTDRTLWPTAADRSARWEIRPQGVPPRCAVPLTITLTTAAGARFRLVHRVPVEIHAHGQFQPALHALPLANSAADFGETPPSRAAFAATYRPFALAESFYHGLYSDVVYLSGDGSRPRPGGLCTGIARLALEHSLAQPPRAIRDRPVEELRGEAQRWHGLQLADQALLASALAWVTQGSKQAYAHLRSRLLYGGRVDFAFDVNVPRPWRRDLVRAFIGSGHTVTPYALHQPSDTRADVWVYDPNYPRPEDWPASVIHFDLARNTYVYRQFRGHEPGRPSKVIAVPQAAYRRGRTGYLAALLSLVLYPNTRPAARPVALAGLVLGVLLSLVVALIRSRKPYRQALRIASKPLACKRAPGRQ